MMYITVKEASEKWNISQRRVCILCSDGRISGAIKKSKVWMIPKNAKKPEDGRSITPPSELDPILLILNPTYFEIHDVLAECKLGRQLCKIQDDFYSGNMERAYLDICRLMAENTNQQYQFAFQIIKTLIEVDCGRVNEFFSSLVELEKLCSNSDSLEGILVKYYRGQIDSLPSEVFDSDVYADIKPVVSYIAERRTINETLANNINLSPINQEIICRDLDSGNNPLMCAYYHMVLAFYYNAKNMNELFEQHLRSAADIMIKRGWCIPLAEFSATINLDFIKKIDKQFYNKMIAVRKKIIDSYSKNGVFYGVSDKPRMDMKINTRIGYLILQDKNNEEIAKELGISKYKVKQHIDDLCTIAGVSSRKEIKEFMNQNLRL